MDTKSITTKLASAGFACAARLAGRAEPDFAFTYLQPACQNVVYAYVDAASGRVLNVGQTGQPFRSRFAHYQRWLNGKDKNRGSAIRRAWLALLAECTAVEVWVRQSSPEVRARLADEIEWKGQLQPLLNVR